MSREVRRVPLAWKHPTKADPRWHLAPKPSRLLRRGEQFVPLHGEQVSAAQQQWDKEREQWEAGEHESLLFSLSYHSPAGWVNHKGERKPPNPLKVYADDGETVIQEMFPTSVAELLAVYPYEEYAGERPTPETHMPDFGEHAELGWCLYETVSEGTPVTPVFKTADELVDHLSTVGEDWDQVPLRRESAERIVSSGGSLASMVVISSTEGIRVLDSTRDADLLHREFPL